MSEKITVPMSKAELLDKIARIMRDRAYPEFQHAPAPLWANDAAQTILTLFEDITRRALAESRGPE